MVREYFKKELYVLPPNSGTNNMFFDFYDQCEHRAVLIDEFYGNWKWSALLQVTDRYPIYVQTRAGSPCLFFPEYLIFTSNKSPREWYLNMEWKYLNRRILKIFHFPAQNPVTKFKKKFRYFIDFEKYGKAQEDKEKKEQEEEDKEKKDLQEIHPSNVEDWADVSEESKGYF